MFWANWPKWVATGQVYCGDLYFFWSLYMCHFPVGPTSLGRDPQDAPYHWCCKVFGIPRLKDPAPRALWAMSVFQGIFSTSTSSCLTHFLLYLVEPLKVLSPWLKKNLSHCEGKKSISSGENIHTREGCSKSVFLSLFLIHLLPSLLPPYPPPTATTIHHSTSLAL